MQNSQFAFGFPREKLVSFIAQKVYLLLLREKLQTTLRTLVMNSTCFKFNLVGQRERLGFSGVVRSNLFSNVISYFKVLKF